MSGSYLMVIVPLKLGLSASSVERPQTGGPLKGARVQARPGK